MAQAKYSLFMDEVTLYSAPSTSAAAAHRAFESSPVNRSYIRPNPDRIRHLTSFSFWSARVRAQLAQKWKVILTVLLVLALFSLLFYGLHLKGVTSSLTNSGNISGGPSSPDLSANESFLNHVHHFLMLKTRLALEAPTGHVINVDVTDQFHCTKTLGFFFPNQHLEAECSSSSSNDGSSTFWRLVNSSSVIDSSTGGHPFQLYPIFKNFARHLFCLMTGNEVADFLTVGVCERAAIPVQTQLFIINVETVSLEHERVFFTIRSQANTGECVGLQDDAKLDKIFQMEKCTAELAGQLFYLNGVDYSDEIAELKTLITDSLVLRSGGH